MNVDLSNLFALYPELTAEQKSTIQNETNQIAERIPQDELAFAYEELLEFAEIRCFLLCV